MNPSCIFPLHFGPGVSLRGMTGLPSVAMPIRRHGLHLPLAWERGPLTGVICVCPEEGACALLQEFAMHGPAVYRCLARALLILVLSAATLGAVMTTAGATQESTKLRLGTATPGGGFPVYGAAFIAAVQGADAGLAIEAINTKGSTENVPMLEEKRLDIALVQGEVVHEVLTGVGRPPADLKIITAMYSTPGMFVVRADSAYRGIADLKGKPVAFGAAGSGLVILARYVLDGLGLDQNKDFQAIYLERAGDGPAMVMDGRATALWGGGSGWPGFTAVAKGEK